MTEPKRWPLHVDNLRMEAIAAAMEIVDQVREANRALVEGETVLAMAHLSDVVALAGQIQDLLKVARDSREIKQWVEEGEG
jgi:hypothetical protein